MSFVHDLIARVKATFGTRPDERMGIRSGFSTFDMMTRGFHNGKLYIGVARPGCGKTSWCTSIAANIMLEQKESVLFISTELNEQEVVQQIIEAYTSGIPVYPNGRVSTEDEVEALTSAAWDIERQMELGHLHIIHEKRLTEQSLERHIVEHCDGRNGGASALVIIDQASRIQRDDKDKHGYAIATEHMLNHLESLADRQDVPILLMSQANRATELQKEITLANIKHSGAFEEFAHCVVLLSKGEHHGKRTEFGIDNSATILVAKNRHGRTGKIPAHFFGESHTWREAAPENSYSRSTGG
jgi:replicative DNA helicase